MSRNVFICDHGELKKRTHTHTHKKKVSILFLFLAFETNVVISTQERWDKTISWTSSKLVTSKPLLTCAIVIALSIRHFNIWKSSIVSFIFFSCPITFPIWDCIGYVVQSKALARENYIRRSFWLLQHATMSPEASNILKRAIEEKLDFPP